MGAIVATITTETTEGVQVGLPILVTLATDLAAKVPTSRTISTTAPLSGGGDLSANRTLALSLGSGLTTSGGNLVPDFGSGSGKVARGNDSRFTDARTPTAHASTHTDGGSDEITVTLAQVAQSGATTGQVPKWSGLAWVPDDETGGGGGGGGGLVLIDSGTFSASSGFSINSVFDSTYDDYLVFLVCTASADVTLAIQLRASGTDSSTGYSSIRSFQYSTTGGVQTDNLGTDEWQVNNLGAVNPPGSTRIDLFSPARAERSSMLGQSSGYFSSTGTIITQFGGSHDVATAYDGMSVRPAGGTITGRWTIFGYAK